MRTITGIVWHCSASKNGKLISREALEAEHKARGFRTIGYHWIIEPDGTLVAGRPESEIGAHVEGFNKNTIGICMIGTDKFTPAAWATAKKCAQNFDRTYPGVGHKGHRDYSPDLNHDGKITSNEWIKMCPSFDVATWKAAGYTPKPENVL